MKQKIIFIYFGCLLSIACCLLPTAVSSQTFAFSATDTIQYGAPGSQLACVDSFVNNTSTGFYIDAVRVMNDTAPNWNTSFCLDVCYPPSVDSAQFYILPNSKQSFILDFYSDTIPDTTIVLMKFKNVLTPANVVYQKFYGITLAGLGTNNLSASQNIKVKIYPSPVIAGNTFCFNISDKQNTNDDFTLLVYDVCGNKTMRIDNLMNGDNYLSLNLPEGIFIYKLLEKNCFVKTGKIVVTH